MEVLEKQVLDEYSRMSNNLARVASISQQLSALQPTILEQLRPLENKLGLVLTLYKASVWAIIVQREEQFAEEEEGDEDR